jgi:SulP family sulfate permease
MMIAAPLASFIPLASLGAVLAVVSWNMAEKKEFVALLKSSRGDALVLVSTFLLTIFEDLTIGIGVGVTLGAFLLLHRLAESVEVQTGEAFLDEDQADDYGGARVAYDSRAASDAEVMVYKISGAIFFGASGTVSAALDEIGRYPRVFIFDFGEAPLVDSTAARALEAFVARLRKAGTTVCVAGARASVRRALLAAGLHEPETLYAATVADARRRASLPPPERGAPLGRTAVAAGGA